MRKRGYELYLETEVTLSEILRLYDVSNSSECVNMARLRDSFLYAEHHFYHSFVIERA